MEVIAEGVETRGQADELAVLKCEYLQGHLLSRPLTRDGAKALFDDVVRQQEPKRDAGHRQHEEYDKSRSQSWPYEYSEAESQHEARCHDNRHCRSSHQHRYAPMHTYQ